MGRIREYVTVRSYPWLKFPAPPQAAFLEELLVQRSYRNWRLRRLETGAAVRREIGLVLVRPADERVVGGIAGHHVYLDDSLRGRGLGAELVALAHVVFPEMLRDCAAHFHERFYSYAGEATYRRAYQLLLTREAIEKPGCAGLTG